MGRPPSSKAVYRLGDDTFAVSVEPKGGRSTFRVRSWFRGSNDRPVEESAKSEADAIAAADRIWEAYQQGLFDNPGLQKPTTVGELREAFVSRADLRPKSRRSYEQATSAFLDHIGAERSLGTVGKRDLELWLATLTCSDVSKATYFRTVRAMLRWGLTNEWLKSDPSKGMSVTARQVMRPWLRFDEWEAFLDACQPAHRIRAAFVLETGLRMDELVHARKNWLHGIVGRVAIRIAPDPTSGFVPKWGQSRAVPLSARAQELLAEAKDRWGDEQFLFSGERLAAPNFARETRRACERGKVTRTDFHGLRRSAGARWLELGIALHDVSRLLGHREITTTMRWYAGISDAHLARCIDVVDAARKAAPSNVIGMRRGRVK